MNKNKVFDISTFYSLYFHCDVNIMKKTKIICIVLAFLSLGIASVQAKEKKGKKITEHYTFELSYTVTRTHVTFKNHFGITLAGDLYMPKKTKGKLAAIAVSGPFGDVKEQASGCMQIKWRLVALLLQLLIHHLLEKVQANLVI